MQNIPIANTPANLNIDGLGNILSMGQSFVRPVIANSSITVSNFTSGSMEAAGLPGTSDNMNRKKAGPSVFYSSPLNSAALSSSQDEVNVSKRQIIDDMDSSNTLPNTNNFDAKFNMTAMDALVAFAKFMNVTPAPSSSSMTAYPNPPPNSNSSSSLKTIENDSPQLISGANFTKGLVEAKLRWYSSPVGLRKVWSLSIDTGGNW